MPEGARESSAYLAVCIPTYRRPQLLRLLLADLTRQTVSIDRLIVVDGDPSTGDALGVLGAEPCAAREMLYVPSNHASLPYQRYLGWKAATGAARLLYLDDDLRLRATDSIETLIRPLRTARGRVVGTTTELSPTRHPPTGIRRRWLRRLGSSHRIPAGGLSPAGHRRPPANRNKPYELVGCLRGGAMAYRMSAITQDCFSDALFAMGRRGWGLGEDILLSRRIGSRGVLLTACRSGIFHPTDHEPVAYLSDGFHRGYATAYSRRLLNDHFRGFGPPRLADRFALIRSYAMNAALNWTAAAGRADGALAFASGYTLGAMRGMLQPPDSRSLTPAIDWWADAETALAQTRLLNPSTA